MTANRSAVLITGATGFLGSALALGLLQRGHALRCVVRGGTKAEADAKLRAALGVQAGREWDRFEVVPGDLARENLGLPAADFLALAHGISRIVHCGARVNMTLPYASLDQSNVRATEDLLRLAESGRVPFSYVSSLAAVAKDVTGEPFELSAPVSGGYAQTKWSADRLVSVAHQEGRIKAAIFRPGRITADSRTARANPDDLLERMIRICVQLEAAPVLETSIRLSPVDWVSQLIVALSGKDEAHGQAYHLIAAATLPWARVVHALRSRGYDLAELPYQRWRSVVVAAGRKDPAVARVCHALPADGLWFDEHAATRPRNAIRTLAGEYPEPPPPEILLTTTINAWQKTGELRTIAWPGPAEAARA